MIKYRTQFDGIEAFEVLRETDKQVVLPWGIGNERRENKVSDWNNWHDSWEAAHLFLIAGMERQIASLRASLEQATSKLEKIKQMKNPEDGND